MFGAPYWLLPFIAAIAWFATLLALLIVWFVDGRPQYESFEENQDIAYISDVGADRLKPLFIAGSSVTIVAFNIALITERYLRHAGKLASNTSKIQKIFSVLAILSSIAGGAGLILLSIFDTRRYETLHNVFLLVFVIGFILCAIFVAIENQRLMAHFRNDMIIVAAFWTKLIFALLAIALAIAFGVTGRQDEYNAAAVIEWAVAFVFFFYLLSFVLDFLPAFRKRMHRKFGNGGDPENGTYANHNGMSEMGAGYGANGTTDPHANEYMFTRRA